jgi:hypothetical protein
MCWINTVVEAAKLANKYPFGRRVFGKGWLPAFHTFVFEKVLAGKKYWVYLRANT